ncbi:hypothetical protein [Bacteriovorax sp. Seq25_V]|uniref:hypothetical protein n=1 Tax=Bacteriovorax sp. Seq25_V TaxID=1201288 RepID=UPI00038A2829|nr:hypothetical protein [Bacteriovorax sp. Seq25_V]EQC47668.1 hypothetical protein M900_A0235 [Bacteriovorax sp. Seq25_V]
MKRITILLLVVFFVAQAATHASSCTTVKILKDKIEKSISDRDTLEEAIFLSDKIKEASKWAEWSDISRKDQEKGGDKILSMAEVESIFSAKEIDILLLMDLLNENKNEIHGEMGVNLGMIGGSLAFSFVGSRVVNKLLAHGYKTGFMKHAQKLIIDDPENKKKASKIKNLSLALAVISPAYFGYKEIQLYSLLKDTKEKLNTMAEVSAALPELSVLEERIENDKIRLMEIESNLTCD